MTQDLFNDFRMINQRDQTHLFLTPEVFRLVVKAIRGGPGRVWGE